MALTKTKPSLISLTLTSWKETSEKKSKDFQTQQKGPSDPFFMPTIFSYVRNSYLYVDIYKKKKQNETRKII
jgi:hypothetical protein